MQDMAQESVSQMLSFQNPVVGRLSTIMKKWKWLFVNAYESNSVISMVMKFLNSYQDGANASVYSGIR
jgi:hypothetical protein